MRGRSGEDTGVVVGVVEGVFGCRQRKTAVATSKSSVRSAHWGVNTGCTFVCVDGAYGLVGGSVYLRMHAGVWMKRQPHSLWCVRV